MRSSAAARFDGTRSVAGGTDLPLAVFGHSNCFYFPPPRLRCILFLPSNSRYKTCLQSLPSSDAVAPFPASCGSPNKPYIAHPLTPPVESLSSDLTDQRVRSSQTHGGLHLSSCQLLEVQRSFQLPALCLPERTGAPAPPEMLGLRKPKSHDHQPVRDRSAQNRRWRT